MVETGRPFIKKTIWKSVGCKANTKTLFLSFSCAESIIVSFCCSFGQQRVTMIFMPLYPWYSVSNIQTEYFLSKWIYPYIYAAAVRFGCQWCKLRNCDVIQICRGWNFQFEFWINWLRWNFLRLGNFEPFLAIGFPSMAIFRPTNAKRNTLVRKKSL